MADNQLTPDQAYNVLVAQVHAPVFFNKLASVYGITPQTPEEAQELLLIAAQLRNAREQDLTKQANDRTNQFAEARNTLNAAMGASGMQPIPQSNPSDVAIKSAAAEVAKNPLIQEAVNVFSSYMAQATAGV